MSGLMIFTKTEMKNLFSKPATNNYPEEPRKYPERTRGHVEINMPDCILCGLCMRSCPTKSIKVDRVTGTWTIDRFDCVQCGYCVSKCPKKCLAIVPGYAPCSCEKKEDVFSKPAAAPAAPVVPAAAVQETK